jgi:lipopolysaccharide export system ATP-binding protein
MALLEVHGLVKRFGRRTVVDGVSFEVHEGEVVGLLGPNGAGKTTSFRMATGQITPNAGKVYFNGQDVTALPMYQRARLGMGYLAQETSVFKKLTCEQNILAILELLPKSRILGRALTRKERFERTEIVLEQFGLTKVRKNIAARCSGGEKRRLEIARCLVCEPLLILLDEPFTGIDPITIAEIRTIIKELRLHGIGLLLTDHNVREALRITTRSYLIKDGKVRTHGSPSEIIHDPIAIKEYLGAGFHDESLGDSDGSPQPTMIRPTIDFVGTAKKQPPANDNVAALIENLKSADHVVAAAELVERGSPVVPALLTALERPDVELRHHVVGVLQAILQRPITFDPYAPQAQRKQQLAALREQLDRPNGAAKRPA